MNIPFLRATMKDYYNFMQISVLTHNFDFQGDSQGPYSAAYNSSQQFVFKLRNFYMMFIDGYIEEKTTTNKTILTVTQHRGRTIAGTLPDRQNRG